MVTETLELVIKLTGASAANAGINSMSSSAKAATSSIDTLNASLAFMRKTLVALSFLRVFEFIGEGISQAQQMNNQLQQIARTAADVPKAFAMFADIALKTHAPVEAVVGLGVQIARSSASYKMSAQEIADATQTIFNTFRLSGSDPTTIKNVTKDLKEIFSLGVVQGRQFRAVILQDQSEALLLAKYIHATGADAAGVNKELDAIRAKGQLPDIYETAMKHKGAFTGADVLRANIAAKPEIDAKAAQTVTTLGQAFTDFYTKWLSFLNTLADSGVFTPIVNLVEYLANNLPTIAVMLLAIGSAIASLYVISTVTTLFQKFFALITSEEGILVLPLLLFGVVIASIFGPQLAKAADQMGGWTELIIRILATTVAIFQALFGNLGATVMNAFVVIGNGIAAMFEWVLNKIILGINFVSTKLNTVLPSGLQIGQIDQQNVGRFDNPYAKTLQESFQSHVVQNYSVLEKAFGNKKAAGAPQFRLPAPPATGDPAGTKDRAEKARAALQDLENMLAQFAGPAVKFQNDISKMTTEILKFTTATKDAKGHVIPALLTETQVSLAFAAAGFKDYNATTHQSASYNDALARSVMGLKNTDLDLAHATDMANAALAIHAVTAAEAAEYIDKARKANELYNLSLDHSIAGGIKLAQFKFSEAHDTPDKIAESTTTKALGFDKAGNLADYNIQLSVLNQLVAAGTISNEAYYKSLQDIQRTFLDTKTDAISGFQKGLLDVQKTMFDTSGDAAKAMTDAFTGLQDTLVTFATTGKISISGLAQSILKDFDTIIIKQQIMQPLMSWMGIGPGSNLGIGQSNGGSGLQGILGSMFGGSNGSELGLGATPATPMWVSIAPSTGDIFNGMSPSAGGSGGAAGLGGDLFSNGGLFSKSGFFSNLFGGTGGGAGSASSGILGALGGLGSLFGFKDGTDFQVGGVGGQDSQLVAFRASPDERVTVQTPQQQRAAQRAAASSDSGGGLHLHLHGVSDFDSFKKSKGQIATGLAQLTSRSVRRNGH